MAMNIKYRPLKAFLLAAETGSFTHAAERLGVSQPSLTALIKDLEDTLGLRLFERTTRSLALSAAGEELRTRIERPVADLEEAYRTMSDLSEARRGALVLGALPSAAQTLIPPTLGALRERRSELEVRVVEAHNDVLIGMLRTNQIEFAIATLPGPTRDLAFQPLFEDVFCAVYQPGHPVEEIETLRWTDLLAHDLILLSQGSSARAHFEHAIQGAGGGEGAGRRCDVTNMVTAVKLVREGLGMALLPSLALPAIELDGLGYRPLADRTAHRPIGLIHRRDRHLSPAARLFAKTLERQIPDPLRGHGA